MEGGTVRHDFQQISEVLCGRRLVWRTIVPVTRTPKNTAFRRCSLLPSWCWLLRNRNESRYVQGYCTRLVGLRRSLVSTPSFFG